MFLLPRLYYSHYGALEGMFLALAIALPVGRLVAQLARHGPDLAAPLVAAVAAAALIAGVGVRDVVGEPRIQPGPSVSAAKALIPAGSCVLTDAPSYTVAANRFISTDPGCPALVDPQGTLIEMTDGRGVFAALAVRSKVSELWLNGFTAARYVWLFEGSATRIPWTPALNAYLASHFRLIAFGSTSKSGGDVPPSGLYVRRLTPELPRSCREPAWACARYIRYVRQEGMPFAPPTPASAPSIPASAPGIPAGAPSIPAGAPSIQVTVTAGSQEDVQRRSDMMVRVLAAHSRGSDVPLCRLVPSRRDHAPGHETGKGKRRLQSGITVVRTST
jgi:hypothetical protein